MNKILFFLYAITLFAFLIFSYVFVDYNFLYLKNFYTGFSVANREITTFIYIAFVLILFIFYFLFLSLARQKKLNMNHLKQLIGISLVTLFFSYPAMLSYDIFNYTTTAKVLFSYHENPYIVMPIEFIGDPSLLYTRAANKIALYGPVWIISSGIPYLLSFGNFLVTLFNFKLFTALFYAGSLYLIWKISRNIFSVSIFALNPLVLIETLVSSHNDIVMMFLAVLSLVLLMRKKIALAIIFFIFSILIKYATLFLVPVFIYVVIKTVRKEQINWEKVFSTSAIFMGIIFLLSAFREEIYPWYAIWVLIFTSLTPNKKIILYLSLAFSFSLLLRYIPAMYTGSYFGSTPFIKTWVTFIPPLSVLAYLFVKNKTWKKLFIQ